MTFKPGDKKPEKSGRKAGTPNKPTLDLKQVLEELGVSPPEQIAQILPTLEPSKQVDVLLKLMEFIFPRRKAVEGTTTHSHQVLPAPLSNEDRLFLVTRARQMADGGVK
jgi:hypothetical protein